MILGSTDQTEWPLQQVSNDQQPCEQNKFEKTKRHNYPGFCDWIVFSFHDLVHVWIGDKNLGTMTAFVI